MNNAIVWVFGPSAAGKETFIHHVSSDTPAELLLRLGWLNKKVIVCSESLAWVVQEDGWK